MTVIDTTRCARKQLVLSIVILTIIFDFSVNMFNYVCLVLEYMSDWP